jgi:hypothetical protein
LIRINNKRTENMKRIFVLITAALAIAILFATLSVNAQPRPFSKEEKIKELSEKLKLNSSQVKKIKEIFEVSDSKIEKVNDKITEQHKKLMSEIKTIINKEDEQVLNLLDNSQKTKYNELKKERDSRPPIEMDRKPHAPKPDGDKQPD